MEDMKMAFDWLNKFTGVDSDDGNEVDNSQSLEEVETSENYGSNKMILLEPRAYSESQQIAEYLKANNSVVVNFKRVTPDQAKRIVDFLSGTLYAIDGDLQQLGGGIFLCTPKSIDVEGSISVESTGKSSKSKKDEEEDFNW